MEKGNLAGRRNERLTKKVAGFIADNILKDGFWGTIGDYTVNGDSRIVFWIEGVDYEAEGLDRNNFTPVLINVGRSTLDPRLFGNGRRIGKGKVADAIYNLYNNVEKPLDFANRDLVLKGLADNGLLR